MVKASAGGSGGRRRAPRSYVRPRGMFGRAAYDDVRLDMRVAAAGHELAAAAYAHSLSVRVAQVIGSAGMSHGECAVAFGVSDEHLSRWLRGARWPTVLDVGRAVARFGTAALPDPSDVDGMLVRARADMEPVAGSGAAARPVRQSREHVMALTSLGSPPFVVVHEPYDEVELAAVDALPNAAEEPLAAAGRVLWTRLRREVRGWDGAPEEVHDVDVDVDLARPRYLDFGQAAGAVGRSFVDMSVELTAEWLVDVHGRGHALLDGWFVVHVVDRDEQGRPARVVVVDVEPDTYFGRANEFGEAEEFRLILRFADVVWLGVVPSVTVRPEGGSQLTVAWLLNPSIIPTAGPVAPRP